ALFRNADLPDLFARRHVPHVNRLRVRLCRGQTLAIRRESHGVDFFLVIREPTKVPSGCRIPQVESLTPIGGDQGLTIWCTRDATDRAGRAQANRAQSRDRAWRKWVAKAIHSGLRHFSVRQLRLLFLCWRITTRRRFIPRSAYSHDPSHEQRGQRGLE